MTCFSILKSSLFAVAAGFIISLAPFSASAQVQPPQEEVDKIIAEDKRKADEQEGKSDSPILLELFTTADCTACVFADRILYDTIKEKNVIALSCKITDLSELRSQDYKQIETNESEEEEKAGTQQGPMDPCVFRLWSYRSSKSSNETKITIPTFIFNGLDKVGAEDTNYFLQSLNSFRYVSKNKTLEVFMRWKDKDTITIHLPEDPNAETTKVSASVWIIRYKDMMVEKVDKGMNKGRVLRFSNIIQDIKHIGKWHSKMRTIDVDVAPPQGGKEKGGYVVVVQEMMGEPVLAAGKLVDYPHPNDIKKTPATGKSEDKERTVAPDPSQEKLPSGLPIRSEPIPPEAPR